MFLTAKALRFIGMGWLSSVMSFGGGDAYLSVAQGLFVEGGVINNADFYGNVVSVANALPGSILCKQQTRNNRTDEVFYYSKYLKTFVLLIHTEY